MDLEHSGIKGQKWGRRRFQYEDGSLTPEGILRYRKTTSDQNLRRGKERLDLEKSYVDAYERLYGKKAKRPFAKNYKRMTDEEIQSITNRYNLEKNYLDAKVNLKESAQRKYDSEHKIKTAIKKLSSWSLRSILAPTIAEISKNELKDLLGPDSDKTTKLFERNLDEYTDAELQAMVNRIKNESLYKAYQESLKESK